MNETDNMVPSAQLKLKVEINLLKARIERLEALMETATVSPVTFRQAAVKAEPAAPALPSDTKQQQDTGFESKLGEYGMAWVGNVVLLFGLIFLTRYLQGKGMNIMAPVVGYASTAGVFILSKSSRSSFSYLSFLFNLTGYVMLFYFTMSLHYLTRYPLIQDKTVTLLLVSILLGVQVYLSPKKGSEILAGMAAVYIIMISMIYGNASVQMAGGMITAGLGMWLLYQRQWWKLSIITLVLTYISLLLWFFNNPLIGNPFQVASSAGPAIVFLAMYAAVYSSITLMKKHPGIPEDVTMATVILNGISFSVMLALIVLNFYQNSYIGIFTTISVFCLAFSALLKKKSPWIYSPSLYALYGFVAISITIYGIYKLPFSFTLLSIQSLLVVSIALWFRSRFIVFMNAMLFLTLMLPYLASFPSANSMNISFSLVALISARIINLQQSRLEIKTDMIRNFYLFAGFFMVLFTLYHIVPKNYITLSWALAAISYFTISIVFKIVKYRYLTLGTLLAAAVYLFLADLAKVEMVYRVVAFLFLALISIGLSTYYVKRLKKKSES